ncbi:MAG: hypothetical protein Ct9H300mP14_02920 [Gammaproteobacteria bacterium]|nr:MAG: hypothetical protein Ct9H300mP14_02920 [Gammaproteobacteria bacterium]
MGTRGGPFFENIPTEYLETYFPIVIESYNSIRDSGGAGKHGGGNGVEKIYRILEPGEVSIHDDRHQSHPWGIRGGKPGACSAKWLIQGDSGRKPYRQRSTMLRLPGDKIIFQTAGAGGWGDPLEQSNELSEKILLADSSD